jgi:hypothetical protein
MYERFMNRFPPDASQPARAYANARLLGLEGFVELVSIGAGVSLGEGIIHVHDEGEAKRARGLVGEAFPEFGDAVEPIAEDWLGRQIAVTFAANGEAELVLFEPGSGEAFEIDCGISYLFDVELIADPVAYLALDLFEEWKEVNSTTPSRGQCVGFKVPLFLGGSGEIDNLEIIDVEVYWSLLGQLRAGTKNLPPGSTVSQVRIE